MKCQTNRKHCYNLLDVIEMWNYVSPVGGQTAWLLQTDVRYMTVTWNIHFFKKKSAWKQQISSSITIHVSLSFFTQREPCRFQASINKLWHKIVNCTLLCKRGLCYFCNSTEYKCRTIRWDSSGGIVTKLQDGPLRDEASILDRNIVLYTIASWSPGAHPSSYPNLGSSYPGLVWPSREV